MSELIQLIQAQVAVLGGVFGANLAPRTAQGAICLTRIDSGVFHFS